MVDLIYFIYALDNAPLRAVDKREDLRIIRDNLC